MSTLGSAVLIGVGGGLSLIGAGGALPTVHRARATTP